MKKRRRVGFILGPCLGAAFGCGGEFTDPIDRVVYRPNGDLVAFSEPIRIFDPKLKQTASISNPGAMAPFQRWSDLSGDGMVAVVVHRSGTTTNADIFHVPDGRHLQTFAIDRFAARDQVIALSPSGDLLFSNELKPPDPNDPLSQAETTFGVRATADGTQLWSSPASLSSPVFSRDGAIIFGIGALAPGTGDDFIYDVPLTALDAATGQAKFSVSAGGFVAAIALDPQGQSLVGILDICISRGCWEYIASWSTADGTLLNKVEVPAGMTFRSDRALTIACATNQDVCASSFFDGDHHGTAVWTTDGTLLRTIPAANVSDYVLRPVFSPDGQFVVIGNQDAVVYRVDDGREVARLPRTTSPQLRRSATP